ncbi:MAG: metal-sensing transcriptional repressor [Anaerolineae bacterium]|nr:metal-sensing transcriptional repressor [Anaerolineae bacterium]
MEKQPNLSGAQPELNDAHPHENKEAVLNRLARLEGHIRAIKRMVEQDTPCPEVLIQIAAVRSALNGVGRVILEDHVKSCLMDAVERGDFEDAFKDLKNSLDKFIG